MVVRMRSSTAPPPPRQGNLCVGLVKNYLGGGGGGGALAAPTKFFRGGCGKGLQGPQAYFLNTNA